MKSISIFDGFIYLVGFHCCFQKVWEFNYDLVSSKSDYGLAKLLTYTALENTMKCALWVLYVRVCIYVYWYGSMVIRFLIMIWCADLMLDFVCQWIWAHIEIPSLNHQLSFYFSYSDAIYKWFWLIQVPRVYISVEITNIIYTYAISHNFSIIKWAYKIVIFSIKFKHFIWRIHEINNIVLQ